MILVGSALKGYTVEANDGKIGTVSDFLFDDKTWKIRWMVVDTGGWLTGRKILVHPSAIMHPDYHREELRVRLSKKQVEDSPDILSDAPVSKQVQTNLYGYYGWDTLWGVGNYFPYSPYGIGAAFDPPPFRGDAGVLEADRNGSILNDGDPELRSTTEIIGYHIQAKDGPIGHLENFLVDDASWGIRYLIIDTKNWWPGKHVLMSPYAVTEISWSQRDVTLDVSRQQVQGSPTWDPVDIINSDYEHRLHGYYGWPGYGW
jgi:sporulation protein YlmC with PRC-barrel domain